MHLFRSYGTWWCIKLLLYVSAITICHLHGYILQKGLIRLKFNTVIGKCWNVNWTVNLIVWVGEVCSTYEQTLHGNLILEQAMKAQMRSRCIYSSSNLRGGWFVSCQSLGPTASTKVCVITKERNYFTAPQTLWEKELNLNFHWKGRCLIKSGNCSYKQGNSGEGWV